MKLHHRHFPANRSDEQPLIILHGLFGSRNNWTAAARTLAAHRSVYTLDLRNHGESPHDNRMSLRDLAEDVREFLDDAAIAQCTLLGHSLGGKTAMQLALDHPTRIGKLIVVDIAPRPYPPRHDAIFAAIDAVDAANIDSRTEADALIQPIIAEQAVRLFLLTNLVRDEYGSFIWRNDMDAIRNNYEAISAAPRNDIHGVYDGPALFIGGSRSPYIETDDRERIQRWFPQAQIEMLDAGHWVHIDQPQAFTETVERFLRNAA